MKLVHFYKDGRLCFGAGTEAGVVDVAEAARQLDAQNIPLSLGELLSSEDALRSALVEFIDSPATRVSGAPWLIDESDLTFGPCVPNPGKILCIGLNYKRNAVESGMPVPETPVLFSKFQNAIAGHREPVPFPHTASQYDYEAELVVVMGRRCKYVSTEDALRCVLGYCNGNDISARDLQMRTSQWLLGKTPDRFLPIGPYLVTADEVGDPQKLYIRCWVNGECRQNSNTSDMIFSIAELVSYFSQYMTLEPGDIISTGTPEGVVYGMKNKVWLKAGDELIVEVEKLGRLINVMSSEKAS